ncbi:hypothetical protein ACFL6S_24750 [Candidatus Poribacteria bacterium]
MRPKVVLFIFLAMVLCSQSYAQGQSPIEIYDRDTIYLYNSFLGNGFVKNNQMMPLSFLGSNLAAEMAGSEYALDEMAKARKYKIIGSTAGFVATAVQIAAIIIYIVDADYVSKRRFQLTTIGIGGTAGILSVGYNRLANGAMNRAVWLYNRDVMSGQLRIATHF